MTTGKPDDVIPVVTRTLVLWMREHGNLGSEVLMSGSDANAINKTANRPADAVSGCLR